MEVATLNNQNTLTVASHSQHVAPHENDLQRQQEATKKQFVEPTISVPVDVLEATAFFQGPTATTAIVP